MPLDAQTRLVTLLGDPVAHSLSPHIHNTAFRAQTVNAAYVATRVRAAELKAAVDGLRALRFWGANVTLPHKQAVRPLLDTASPRAEAVGAVNTIVCRGTDDARLTLHGDNTDVAGFLTPLQAHADRLHHAPMLIFGAGGAAPPSSTGSSPHTHRTALRSPCARPTTPKPWRAILPNTMPATR